MNIQLIAQAVKAYRNKDISLVDHYKRLMTKEEIAERDRQLREIRLSERPCYFR